MSICLSLLEGFGFLTKHQRWWCLCKSFCKSLGRAIKGWNKPEFHVKSYHNKNEKYEKNFIALLPLQKNPLSKTHNKTWHYCGWSFKENGLSSLFWFFNGFEVLCRLLQFQLTREEWIKWYLCVPTNTQRFASLSSSSSQPNPRAISFFCFTPSYEQLLQKQEFHLLPPPP